MAEKLEFDLTVKNNGLQKSLDAAAVSANTLSFYFAGGVTPAIESANTAASRLRGSMSDLSNTIIGVAAGQLAFVAIQRAIGFVTGAITSSIQAFAEQEDAINKLKQSFILTGGASESAVDGVQAFASALRQSSKFSDENIIKQVAFVKSLGASTQASKDLVTAAANMSAVLGGSLEENTQKVGKTLSGLIGRLGQYIPELRSLTKEQLEAGAAADVINKKFGGSAANDLNTYAGKIEALKNAYTKLEAEVGKTVAGSSAVGGVLDYLKAKIDGVGQSFAANSVKIQLAGGASALASKTTQQLADDYVLLGKEVDDLTKKLNGKEKPTTILGFLVSDPLDLAILAQVDRLKTIRAEIETKLSTTKRSDKKEGADDPSAHVEEEAERVAREKREADILAADKNLAILRNDFKREQFNIALGEDYANEEAEIQRIYERDAKLKAVEFELKEKNAVTTLQGKAQALELEKIEAEKTLALKTLYLKKENALFAQQIKDEKKVAEQATKDKITNLGYQNQQTAAAFGLATTLAKQGSKEQYYIQKAAAVAQVGFAYAIGMAKALELTPNFAAVAAAESNATIVAGLSLATIASQTLQGLATGGIVGDLAGATMGSDNTTIHARDGEMMLNADQQKKLFDGINSGSFGGGQVVIQIDGREIARAVRDQTRQGFKLA